MFKKNNKTDKNQSFWELTPDSHIMFKRREQLHDIDNEPESIFNRTPVVILLLLLCSALDFLMFYQIFTSATNESLIARIAGTFVVFVAFDIGPAIMAIEIRRHYQGLKCKSPVVLTLSIAFVLAFLASAFLRYTLKDTILSGSNYSMSGLSAIDQGTNPAAFSYFVFCTVAPIATSFVSFAASYIAFDPAKIYKQKLERMIDILKARISQYESILSEFKAEEGFKERIMKDERIKFAIATREAQNQGVYLCDYVREKLKEHMSDPAAVNALSKASCLKVIGELDKTRQAILDYDLPDEADFEDNKYEFIATRVK